MSIQAMTETFGQFEGFNPTPPVLIEHSDQIFYSTKIAMFYRPSNVIQKIKTFRVWPIEEYLVRSEHSVEMEEKIKTAYPNGKIEGAGVWIDGEWVT